MEEWITVENTHEALIPASLFQKVAASMNGERQPRPRSHAVGRRLMLFSSAITCKHCGANYQCRPRRRNGKVYEYYECYGPSSGQTALDCDCWSLNVDKLKTFIFGEISKRVSNEAFQAAMKGYLIGRLGQLLRGTVLNTEDLERQVRELTSKKSRIIDSIADGMVPRGDPTVATKLHEIDDQLLLLTARLEEIEGVRRTQLDPDLIATRLIERVRNLTGFLESHRVEDQRKALFAFCKRIVADAMIKEVVIETDLIGLAQLPDTEELPVGTPLDVVAALGQENAQPATSDGLCNCTLPE